MSMMLAWIAGVTALSAPSAPALPFVQSTDAPIVLPMPADAPNADEKPVFQGTIIYERRVMVRVPARSQSSGFGPMPMPASSPRVLPGYEWREKKAGRCIPVRALAGVKFARESSIDLVTAERQLMRARLERGCRAMDFYSGFYVEKSSDGQLCADRDYLHARSGAKCQVDNFSYLVPVARRR